MRCLPWWWCSHGLDNRCDRVLCLPISHWKGIVVSPNVHASCLWICMVILFFYRSKMCSWKISQHMPSIWFILRTENCARITVRAVHWGKKKSFQQMAHNFRLQKLRAAPSNIHEFISHKDSSLITASNATHANFHMKMFESTATPKSLPPKWDLPSNIQELNDFFGRIMSVLLNTECKYCWEATTWKLFVSQFCVTIISKPI